MTTVSAIIPTFNRWPLLRESLRSVLSQTHPPKQVIVVDDGSTDDTTARVAAEFGNVVLLRQANGGKSAALNSALRLVNEPLVWIMDDDDIALPDGLERLVQALDAAPLAGFAYGWHERFRDDVVAGEELTGPGHWRYCTPETFLAATLEDMFVHQGSMLVRHDLYRKAGPFRETLLRSIDYEMLLRLGRLAKPVIVQAPIFRYRLHDGPRGPAGALRTNAEREAEWMACDQRIFLGVRQEWPLSSYLPDQTEPDGPAAHRTALLQRATIMSRHKLWDLALSDFEAAAEVFDGPLTADEKLIVRRAMGSKFGCDDLLKGPALPLALHGLADLKGIGPSLCRLLARGLIWRFREALVAGRLRRAARLAQAISIILGGRLAAGRIPVVPAGERTLAGTERPLGL